MSARLDEIRQVEALSAIDRAWSGWRLVVASSIGADLAMAFLTQHEAARRSTLSLTAGSSPKSERARAVS